MVHFSRHLRRVARPEWREAYMDYKRLKQLLKLDEPQALRALRFSQCLDNEIEKVALHSLCVQGDLARELQRLLEAEAGGAHARDVVAGLHRVAWELVELLRFVEVNSTCLRKALKKRDKQLETSLTTNYLETADEAFLAQTYHPAGVDCLVSSLRRALQRNDGGEAVLDEIGDCQQRLVRASGFLAFLGSQAALHGGDGGPQGALHKPSLWLNLLSTFLYMMTYYVALPSSGRYAKALGAESSLAGMVIGMTPLAACMATVLYSWWSNSEFRRPLLFCTAMVLVGNVVYAAAYDAGSFAQVLAGRLMVGLGGARAINRRYIADTVPLADRTMYSAAFVTAGALGMAAGPLTSALLDSVMDALPAELPLLGSVNEFTAPGWLMAALWLVYLAVVAAVFVEPDRPTATATPAKESYGAAPDVDADELEKGAGRALTVAVRRVASRDEDTAPLLSKPMPMPSPAPSESSHASEDSQREDLRPLALSLGIYFALKMVLELVLTSAPVITHHHFRWSTMEVSSFVSALSLTVLPINYVVGRLSRRFDDRLLVVAAEVATMLGLAVFLRYGAPDRYHEEQFLVGSCVAFVSVNVLEGVNMSLLSKIVPPRLARGVFNAGFLATEAGTFGRAVGDFYFSAVGVVTGDGGHIINPLFGPMAALMGVTLLSTWKMYERLVPGVRK